jgi:hypothetical protein
MGYESGKIYKLQCSDGYYYIGSTIQTLKERLILHKRKAKQEGSVKNKKFSHINQLGWDNVEILLLQDYTCQNKRELEKKEQEFINLNDVLCLNTQRAFQTKEERSDYMRDFRSSHQDEIRSQMKEWKLHNRSREDHNAYNNANYHKNKETINAKRRAKRVALLNNDERQRSLAGN